MPVDEERRARLRAKAGVSTRGAEVPEEAPGVSIVNAAGAGTTDLIEALVAGNGGTAAALALVLEGVMLNVAWHLWSNAQGADADAFRAAFAKLATSAADEVLASTEQPAGETPAG